MADCATVNGKTVGENISDAAPRNDTVIRTRDRAAVSRRRHRDSPREPGAERRGD